jgi:hypothetical protein
LSRSSSSGIEVSQPDGDAVKALARAHRWKRLLEAGVQISVTEIAVVEGPGP